MDYLERIAGPLAFLIIIACFSCALMATEPILVAYQVDESMQPPSWCLIGIAGIETSSYYAHGHLVYVNRDDGDAGEVGPFQLTHDAFILIGHHGESFASQRHNSAFAEICCRRYLSYLYARTGSWAAAVAAYHVGLHGSRRRGLAYAQRAFAAGDRSWPAD